MSNKNKVAPNIKQIKQVAQLVVYQYQKAFPQGTIVTLKQMLVAILQNKQQQIQHLRLYYSLQVQNQVELNNRTALSHIAHYSEEQMKQIEEKKYNQAILKKVIDLKNAKVQQHEHLSLKYDQLLGMFKKLRSNNEQLKDKISKKQSQNKNLFHQNLTLKAKLSKLEQKIRYKDEAILKIKKSIQQINIRHKEYQVIILKCLADIKDPFKQSITKTIKQYTAHIKMYQQTIKQMKQDANFKENRYRQNVADYDNIIKELVIDLSQATKIRKKQSETEAEWLKFFRAHKMMLKKKADLELNKRAVYQEVRSTNPDHRSFVNNQKRFLNQVQRQL